ncbi:MAG: hypothetical protein OEU32_00315 [Acidimicrobiia bacterium]|nr:hypothetical protein [Acidimicrobiia bacterium]
MVAGEEWEKLWPKLWLIAGLESAAEEANIWFSVREAVRPARTSI